MEDQNSYDSLEPNLRSIKVSLQYDRSSFERHHAALEELTDLGGGAAPLIPLVADMVRTERLKTNAGSVVKLYLACPHPVLLNAMLDTPAFREVLGWDDKCRLMQYAGVTVFEPELLEILWQRHGPEAFERRMIVEALAVSGSAKALELLEEISSRVAGRLPEMRLAVNQADEDEITEYQKLKETEADETFYDAVRGAIEDIEKRLADEKDKRD